MQQIAKTVKLKPVERIPAKYGKWGDVILDFFEGAETVSEVMASADATTIHNSLFTALKRMPEEVRQTVTIMRRNNRVYLTKDGGDQHVRKMPDPR